MIEVEERNGIYRIKVNNPIPPVEFNFQGERVDKIPVGLKIIEGENSVVVEKKLELEEHIVGLGEKATELDRKRFRYVMYNVDAGAYKRFQDPLYANIPFFISIYKGKATGYFVNSASKVIIDVGFTHYSKIIITIPHKDVEIYVFEGPTPEKVIEKYTDVTGKPYLPPKWAFGYLISRFSYFPQDEIVKLLDLMKEFKVTGIFLDIDYMDSYKLFTWDKEKFPDVKKFIEEVHERGVKIITIVDHSVKADQNYDVFLSGLGKYCETDKGELFVGKLWPGNSVYPDFFREETRKWWSELISKWLSQGIDGIWLDMNEPTDFSQYKEGGDRLLLAFPKNVIHYHKGKKVYHELIRNAYPYYEAMATYEGFKNKGEVFILTRGGYAGIQKFAGIWTGDNTPSWDDLKLQLQLVLGLSISGIAYVGIDIGGFQGRGFEKIDNSLELLVKYFEIAMFFPLFRTHKAKDGIDTEPAFLPDYYKEKVKRVIETRYRFLSYLYSLALEAHETGHPIIRPLFYEFPDDENTYRIDDEYMVGKHILYAPIIEKSDKRIVYLPRKSKWMEFWNQEISEGWVNSKSNLPIYIREGSLIQLDDGDVVSFSDGEIKGKAVRKEKKITFNSPTYVRNIISEFGIVKVDKVITQISL
ncbi:alpha-glucosidase MalA [Sulfurisphaera ohwakuensis]|uniref:Alpha-glucosidase n=1 Tax=Sulfurisphaera ohwakuensis TaxID=69656 RepID=A0A650CK78_SULOH|nr:alpha-glucosidase MalA [Sulfurisphaera ohwakuensis]MBB5254513.1 alpha-glucosidase [Sulfurisphaera ohwakuensis]QGR18123.1 glycoside hydrolase family 31 protein [Sulfurisphaera ohwakuensis]